jgi:hypothetical protein
MGSDLQADSQQLVRLAPAAALVLLAANSLTRYGVSVLKPVTLVKDLLLAKVGTKN